MRLLTNHWFVNAQGSLSDWIPGKAPPRNSAIKKLRSSSVDSPRQYAHIIVRIFPLIRRIAKPRLHKRLLQALTFAVLIEDIVYDVELVDQYAVGDHI